MGIAMIRPKPHEQEIARAFRRLGVELDPTEITDLIRAAYPDGICDTPEAIRYASDYWMDVTKHRLMMAEALEASINPNGDKRR